MGGKICLTLLLKTIGVTANEIVLPHFSKLSLLCCWKRFYHFRKNIDWRHLLILSDGSWPILLRLVELYGPLMISRKNSLFCHRCTWRPTALYGGRSLNAAGTILPTFFFEVTRNTSNVRTFYSSQLGRNEAYITVVKRASHTSTCPKSTLLWWARSCLTTLPLIKKC